MVPVPVTGPDAAASQLYRFGAVAWAGQFRNSVPVPVKIPFLVLVPVPVILRRLKPVRVPVPVLGCTYVVQHSLRGMVPTWWPISSLGLKSQI